MRKTSVVVAGARTCARGGRSNERDRYGRIVGKVLTNGIDACLEQVKAGFAWHYKKYQHEHRREDQMLYADAETKARDERLGLWRESYPVPPWEHRRLYR